MVHLGLAKRSPRLGVEEAHVGKGPKNLGDVLGRVPCERTLQLPLGGGGGDGERRGRGGGRGGEGGIGPFVFVVRDLCFSFPRKLVVWIGGLVG